MAREKISGFFYVIFKKISYKKPVSKNALICAILVLFFKNIQLAIKKW